MTTGRTLLVLGHDKLGRRCHAHLSRGGLVSETVDVALDRSSNAGRLLRLVRKGRMPLRCVARLALAEFFRADGPAIPGALEIRTNQDLRDILGQGGHSRVLLFRAGLIIDRQTLALGIPFHNVHCASIPDYAGLCSIWRALRDRAYAQQATLHVVTTTIDDPSEVLDTEPYDMDPASTYRRSEDLAYEAGMRLLARTLDNSS